MDHSALTRALCALLLAAASACATTAPVARSGYAPAKSAQLPGPKLLGTEAEVAAQYACANQKASLVLEESSLAPSPLGAGQEFGHRVVYALCPAREKQGIAGTLRTRIRFGTQIVVEDSAPYRIEPGRWAVDTFIALPPHAKPGAYEVEVEFASAASPVRFATKVPFSVWVKTR
ncbi:MAG: hypothetical protein FJ091_08785 [Deltaproteobacteria bacterium]|nr:hypothetical protein [Deltaproteobacteria bacterium]